MSGANMKTHIKKQENSDGLYVHVPTPICVPFSKSTVVDIYQLRPGAILICNIDAKMEIFGYPVQSNVALLDTERSLVNKLSKIRFFERTEQNTNKILDEKEISTLENMILKKYITVFKNQKYPQGVYNITNKVFQACKFQRSTSMYSQDSAFYNPNHNPDQAVVNATQKNSDPNSSKNYLTDNLAPKHVSSLQSNPSTDNYLTDNLAPKHVSSLQSNPSNKYSTKQILSKHDPSSSSPSFMNVNSSSISTSENIQISATSSNSSSSAPLSSNQITNSVTNPQINSILHLQKFGYMVISNEAEAKIQMQNIKVQIKNEDVCGVRGFDKKYYVIKKSYLNSLEPLISVLLNQGTSNLVQIASKLNLPSDAITAVLVIMADEGLVIEKRRGEWAKA